MVPTTLILTIAILTIFVARKLRAYYALKAFGGHWSSGWSRLWLLKTQSSGRMNKIFTDINREYGMCNFSLLAHFVLQLPFWAKRWRHMYYKIRFVDQVAQAACCRRTTA